MKNEFIVNIGDISETLLLPLYGRAIESQSKNPIVKDIKAEEIVKQLHQQYIGIPDKKTEYYRRLPRKIYNSLKKQHLQTNGIQRKNTQDLEVQ